MGHKNYTNKISGVLSIIAIASMISACRTTQKVASSGSVKGESTLYSTDDSRTAMPDAKTARPYKNASENLADELKKNPKDVDSKINLAQIKLIQGHLDESESLCKEALRLNLKNIEAKKILAEIAFRRGNLDLASIIISSLDNHGKKDSQMLNLLALVALKRGENSLAMAHFKQALQVNPDDIAVRLNLGVLYLKYRQLQSASVQFERILKSMPDNRDAKLHLAIIKATRGQNDDAEKIYADILSEKDGNPLALFNIAVAQKNTGEFDKALDNLKAYLKTKPSEGSQANEAFALIDEIQSEKSSEGDAVTDDEIQELAAKVANKTEEDTEENKPQPQVAVQAKATKEEKPAQAKPLKSNSDTGEDADISELEKQLK